MKRKILVMLLVLLLLPVQAFGADQQGSGTILVTVQLEEQPVSGGTMTLYTIPETVGAGLIDSISEQTSETLAKELAKDVSGYDSQSAEINEQGRATFRNLMPGVYLLVQTQAAEGYLAADPFLVTLTAGQYVEALPKIEPILEEEPGSTPTPTPTPTPVVGPVDTPTPSQATSPEPSASPEPSTAPEPTSSPEPSTAPEPTSSPEPSASTEPAASTEPGLSPSPSPAASAAVSPVPGTSQKPTEQKTLTNPFTGDEINLDLSIALVGTCLVALGGILWFGRKKQK